MFIARQGDAVVVWAPAKVNLFLEVLAKRADGYHEIATLMVAVSLYDTLNFREETPGKIHLQCNKNELSTGPDNLVLRAAALLAARAGCSKGARIDLEKRIPLAAGLAGGSSDAAATLAGLNRLWNLRLTEAALAEIGSELGSDVAFFFSAPTAWCTGRGEKVAPMRLWKDLSLVLVCPRLGLKTADVYRNVAVPTEPRTGEDIRQALARGDLAGIGRGLHNRLQPTAERLCPEIAALYRRLESLQPAGCLMSGSGTSLFALCRNRPEAERIAQQLRQSEEKVDVFLVDSCF